jgi:hypothetical protein
VPGAQHAVFRDGARVPTPAPDRVAVVSQE